MIPAGWSRALDRPLVIAHRGASRRALENTVPAFLAARAEGADGVELDVWCCGSGEVVVFHDEDLWRLGGRTGRVTELPLAALREVRLRGEIGGGEIPTLAETLEAAGPLLVNIELKAPRACDGALLAARVAGIVRRFDLGRRAIVSSFNPLALLRFRRVAPAIPSALLFGAEQSLPLRRAMAAPLLQPFALHPEHRLVETGRVRDWHRAGRAVNTWTVDDPAEARRLAALGVDGIITNQPAEILAALAR